MGQALFKNTNGLILSDKEFEFFQSAIKRLAGIHMTAVKKDLIQARLRTRVQQKGYSNFSEYKEYLEKLPSQHAEWTDFINLLTTNKTDFFREPAHFDFLKNEFVPKWLQSKSKVLKVWCAASSTGEEPYTIAMTLAAVLPADRDFHILATDIDTEVLTKANNAVYSINKRSEIPASYQSYIQVGQKGLDKWMRIHPSLKEKVVFQRFNLVNDKLPKNNEFDLIFCRNVLIYFTPETIESVLSTLYPTAKNGGILFVSHSESLQNLNTHWKFVAPSIYIKGGSK